MTITTDASVEQLAGSAGAMRALFGLKLDEAKEAQAVAWSAAIRADLIDRATTQQAAITAAGQAVAEAQERVDGARAVLDAHDAEKLGVEARFLTVLSAEFGPEQAAELANGLAADALRRRAEQAARERAARLAAGLGQEGAEAVVADVTARQEASRTVLADAVTDAENGLQRAENGLSDARAGLDRTRAQMAAPDACWDTTLRAVLARILLHPGELLDAHASGVRPIPEGVLPTVKAAAVVQARALLEQAGDKAALRALDGTSKPPTVELIDQATGRTVGFARST